MDSNSQLVINEATTSKSETNNGIALPYKVEPEKQIQKYREYLEVCDMDYTTANKIFTLLDQNDMNAEDLVSAFDYFSFFDGAQLKKKREPYGGIGLAEIVIKRWANDPASNHTVNDLKQIIKTRLKRKDVLTVIKNWEMKFPAEHVEKGKNVHADTFLKHSYKLVFIDFSSIHKHPFSNLPFKGNKFHSLFINIIRY